MANLMKIEVPYNGQNFFIDVADGNLINLNKIHEISGSSQNRKPKEWLRLSSVQELLQTLDLQKAGKSRLLQIKRGKGGGTWAHWQVALSYAQYLSPELHLTVNQVFKERLQESINPELGIEKSRQRARKTWKSQGKSEDWIAKREQGIDIRKIYVDTLLDHDVKAGYEVAKCTNSIYKGIFKKDKAQLEEDLRSQNPNLPKTVNIRDHAKLSSLAAIALAEALSSEVIQEETKSGVNECSQVSYEQGQSVSLALDDSKKRRNCISDIF